jgi:hypothetical protein
MNKATIDDAPIREKAYLIWLDEGLPEGRDEEHWLRAVDALNTPVCKVKAIPKAVSKTRTSSSAPKKAAKSRAKAKPVEK